MYPFLVLAVLFLLGMVSIAVAVYCWFFKDLQVAIKGLIAVLAGFVAFSTAVFLVVWHFAEIERAGYMHVIFTDFFYYDVMPSAFAVLGVQGLVGCLCGMYVGNRRSRR